MHRQQWICALLVSNLALSVLPLPPMATLAPLLLATLLAAGQTASQLPPIPLRLRHGLLLFFASFALSTALSSAPLKSLNSALLLFPGLLVLYLYTSLTDPGLRRACLATGASLVIVVTSLLAISAILIADNHDPSVALDLFQSRHLVVPNDLLLCLVLLPLAAWGANQPHQRWLHGLALGCCCTAVLLSESRLCLGLLLLVSMAALWLYRPRLLLPGMLALGSAMFFADWAFDLGLARKLAESWQRNQRLGIWYIAVQGAGERPLLGVGPGNFEPVYRWGVESLSLPAWMQWDKRSVPWAHSLYLEALVERGLLGLASLVALLWAIWRQLRAALPAGSQRRHSLPLALLLCYTVFLLAGLFESTLQRDWVVTLLFLLTAAAAAPIQAATVASPIIGGRLPGLLAGLTLALLLLGTAAAADREQVERAVEKYCASLAEQGQQRDALAARRRDCEAAFRLTLDAEPQAFFHKAGNPLWVAFLRNLWWQLDFRLAVALPIVLALGLLLARRAPPHPGRAGPG